MSVKELEERVMINKEQYEALEDDLKTKYPSFKIIHNKNRYLDDQYKTIEKLQNALRIRSFGNSKNRELTYKVKGEDGDIEYTEQLSYYWFHQIIDNRRINDGELKNALLKDDIDISSLKVLVELRTRRIEFEGKDFVIAVDGNIYNNHVDFNLEVESKISKKHAKTVLLDLCKQYGIEYKADYIVKSKRALDSVK